MPKPSYSPNADHSALAARLECVYNLVYVAEAPDRHGNVAPAESLRQLQAIRPHLDAMKVILRRMASENADGRAA